MCQRRWGMITSDLLKCECMFKPLNIVIDPGHGRRMLQSNGDMLVDVGTTGYDNKYCESINVLIIARILADMFAQRGHKPILTRTDAQNGLSLTQRCDIAKNAHADLVLSLHCDSSPSDAYEMRCYYRSDRARSRYPDAAIAKSIADNAPDILRKTPSVIIACAPKTMDLKIGVAPRAYNVLRHHGDYPAILIECGFISQKRIAEYLQSPEGRLATAQGICNGVFAYFSTV